MKVFVFFLIALQLSLKGYSQTERIAHRSHSGKNSSFAIRGNGNWGLSPAVIEAQEQRRVIMKMKADSIAKKAKLDSLAKKYRSPYSLKTRPIDRPGKMVPLKLKSRHPRNKFLS